MKLIQKQFLKGVKEFEIGDTMVNIRIKTLLKEKELTVDLSMINPEPMANEPFLEFHSRVKGGPLLTLLINKPNATEFNTFVDVLKQRARQQYSVFTGLRSSSLPEGMAANVFEEPPEWDTPAQNLSKETTKPISAANIDLAIQMLERYMDAEDIKPFMSALEALKTNPENPTLFRHLVMAFEDLGPQQGAVLTYAPYISVLLSDDPFG